MFQRSKMRDEHWRAGPGARTAGAMRYMAAWMRPWFLVLFMSWVGAEVPRPRPSTRYDDVCHVSHQAAPFFLPRAASKPVLAINGTTFRILS